MPYAFSFSMFFSWSYMKYFFPKRPSLSSDFPSCMQHSICQNMSSFSSIKFQNLPKKGGNFIINHLKKLTWTWSFNRFRKFHYHTSKLRNGIQKMILHLQSHIWYSNKILKNILLTSLVMKNLCLSISEVWEGSMKVFSRIKCCYRDEYFGQIYQSKIAFIFRQLHLHFCKTWR